MTKLYEVRIEGHLDDRWQDWFDGWTVTRQADGTTFLSGPVPDQPALYTESYAGCVTSVFRWSL